MMHPGCARLLHACAGISLSVALVCGLGGQAFAQPRTGGVASINQCADQIALALGPPGSLRAVSRLVDETPSGAMAPDLPRLSGGIDSVLGAGVATVLMGPEGRGRKGQLLRGFGVDVVVLDPPGSLEGLAEAVDRAGAALDAVPQAAVLAANLRQAAIPPRTGREAPRALWLAPNLLAMGRGTLADSVLSAAGWANALRDDQQGWVRLSLEQVLMTQASQVLLAAPEGQSRAEALLRHPALIHAIGARTRLSAGALGCDPVGVLRAIDTLSSWRLGEG